MTAITPEVLEELRVLCEKATPAPWRSFGMGGDSYLTAPSHKWHRAEIPNKQGFPIAVPRFLDYGEGVRADPFSAGIAHDDARLIAAARNHLPALLSRIESDADTIQCAADTIADLHRLRDSGDAATIARQASELSSLKEEVERLREALTPSAETKAAYMGEFSLTFPIAYTDEDGEPQEEQRQINVPWTTVKEIMKAISDRAARQPKEAPHG